MSVPEYQQYPMMMTHPGFRPARLGTSPDDRKGTPGTQGQAAYMPPVTVADSQQEEYHASQGYQPAGKGNPAAFVQAHTSPETPYHREEYPKYVGDIVVHNEDEEIAAMEKNERRAAEAEAARIRAEAEAKIVRPDVDDRINSLESKMDSILEAIANMNRPRKSKTDE